MTTPRRAAGLGARTVGTDARSDLVVADFLAAVTAHLDADRVAEDWIELLRQLTHVTDVEPDEVLVRRHTVAEHLYFLVEE